MPYQRGEIIEVNLAMPPDGKVLNHPAVIISNTEVFRDDDCYIVVMLTSRNNNDVYSYALEDYMFIQGAKGREHSEVRCHLITYILEGHIVQGKRARLKKQFVDEIVDHVIESSLLVR